MRLVLQVASQPISGELQPLWGAKLLMPPPLQSFTFLSELEKECRWEAQTCSFRPAESALSVAPTHSRAGGSTEAGAWSQGVVGLSLAAAFCPPTPTPARCRMA